MIRKRLMRHDDPPPAPALRLLPIADETQRRQQQQTKAARSGRTSRLDGKSRRRRTKAEIAAIEQQIIDELMNDHPQSATQPSSSNSQIVQTITEHRHAFLTIKDLAKRWNVSERTLRREFESGRLEGVRIRKQIRFDPLSVARYEAAFGNRVKPVHICQRKS